MTSSFINKWWNAFKMLSKWELEAGVEVLENNITSTSYYKAGHGKEAPAVVMEAGYNRSTLGHEYGHSVFDAVYHTYGIYPDCTALKDQCAAWGNSAVAVSAHLDKVCLRYGLNPSDLTPVADVMGMYLNQRIPYYACHNVGYAARFAGTYSCYRKRLQGPSNHIYEDEWFAGICGLFYTNNWKALDAIHELFPASVEQCLVMLKKAMGLLKGKKKR